MKNKWESINVWLVVPLLFTSGLCALVYQVVWLRELRLIFGSSTAASGVVLAVFMGGLGAGSVFFGRIADRLIRPLFLYAALEVGIAISTALSPFLISLVSYLYIGLGGGQVLGLPLAMLLRLSLSALVLLVPTFLMGGTLPAVARAVETEADKGRRDVALLYGVNALGGVLGVTIAIFVLLEMVGNRFTLWSAAILNLLVGIIAYGLAGYFSKRAGRPGLTGRKVFKTASGLPGENSLVPAPYIYAAAFVAGFSFLLMELVWNRMLTPILGGTTYTFGLILAVALAGIGLGAAFFSTWRRDVRTSLTAFVFVCGLEVFFTALPYALGDRLALAAALFSPLGNVGFLGQIVSWTIITAPVVLPVSILAGIKFPLLIGLLGQGRQNVGHHSGHVYAFNTAGAILGALAGGLGLLPILTAPGCWKMVVLLQALLGVTAILLFWHYQGKRALVLVQTVIIIAPLVLLCADGPTAVWRHSAIGVGHRVDLSQKGRNEIRKWENGIKRRTIWEREGVESSIALRADEGLALMINGKPDGHVTGDAGTQVMGPLIAAALHPAPRRGMVVGLGTGSSAGWLAAVATMEYVDVVELEPAMLEVARRCAPVNREVMENTKVRVVVGDARELLQVGRSQYDVIFSEPSNPYRAGIASLYTTEFYQAVAGRLAAGGFFSQWVNGYYIDAETLRTICVTLASVFPNVEIWMTHAADLLFVCSSRPTSYSVPELRQRLLSEPFRSAMLVAWGVEGLEGFLAGFVARPELVRMIAEQDVASSRINTDDRMLAEFGFARAAGKPELFSIDAWRQRIRDMNMHRPPLLGGVIDWSEVDENFFQIMLWTQKEITPRQGFSRDELHRFEVNEDFLKGNLKFVLDEWSTDRMQVGTAPLQLAQFGMALANVGDERAFGYAERLRPDWPADSDAIMARCFWRRGEYEDSLMALDRAIKGFRYSPWRVRGVMMNTLKLATEMALYKPFTVKIFDLLSEPFSVFNLEEFRKDCLLIVASLIDDRHGAKTLSLFEPHVPWEESFLRYRRQSYIRVGDQRAERASLDLQDYLRGAPGDFFNSNPVEN